MNRCVLHPATRCSLLLAIFCDVQVPPADPNMRDPQTAHIVLKMIAGQAEARASKV